jgi:hypothetical protein
MYLYIGLNEGPSMDESTPFTTNPMLLLSKPPQKVLIKQETTGISLIDRCQSLPEKDINMEEGITFRPERYVYM